VYDKGPYMDLPALATSATASSAASGPPGGAGLVAGVGQASGNVASLNGQPLESRPPVDVDNELDINGLAVEGSADEGTQTRDAAAQEAAPSPQPVAAPEVSEFLTNLEGVWSSSSTDLYGWSMQASLSGFQMSQGDVQFVRTSNNLGSEAFSVAGPSESFSLEALAGSATPFRATSLSSSSGGFSSAPGLAEDLEALRQADSPSRLVTNPALDLGSSAGGASSAFDPSLNNTAGSFSGSNAADFLPSTSAPVTSGAALATPPAASPPAARENPAVPATPAEPDIDTQAPADEDNPEDITAEEPLPPEPPAEPVAFALQTIEVDASTTEVVGTNGNNVLVWDEATVGTASMGQGFNELSAPDSADLTMSYAWADTPVQADLLSGVGIVWDEEFTEVLAFDALSGGWNHLIGGAGSDSLAGNGNANRLNGGEGNDVLVGLAGADTLIGGGGDDLLILESGLVADVAIGGTGNDTFLISPSTDAAFSGNALSQITDFNWQGAEQIVFARSAVLGPLDAELVDLMKSALPVGFEGQSVDAPYWFEGGAVASATAVELGRRVILDTDSEQVRYESFDADLTSWVAEGSVQVTGLIGLSESDGFLLSSKFFDFG
jgi:hypothetical protein